MARLVIDPVTRIEGHLRIEANLDGGKITDAWSSGTMFRGIEMILQGRDPREAWIWAQRICGVCTMVHASRACARWKTLCKSTFPKTRASCAISSPARRWCRITWSTFITCTRWTGWMSLRL
jgi:Ni,Fe-hydrogenase I large subunit